MIVKCIANTGQALSSKFIDLGYTKDYKFSIIVGQKYAVYGMSMWKGSLEYLISEKESENPIWCPAELFEVASHPVPIFWYFNFEKYTNYSGQTSEKAFWGYKELVEIDEHYSDLLENKPETIEIFKKRKGQIDEYEGI